MTRQQSSARSVPRSTTQPWRQRLIARLFEPVDAAPVAYFRIAFGAIMFWEVLRFFGYGWIERYYITPTFHFTYYGFSWVRPWPPAGMYLHFYALGALALCVMLGLWYRVTATLFFLSFTFVFLLEQARYLNHFYLIIWISLLLAFIPAHRALSLDARRRPEIRSTTVPAWSLWLLRAQIGLAYSFGGIAKIGRDWLQGEPMRSWLAARTDFPLIGGWFTDEWVVLAFSWGGLLFDLSIVPLLLWRRTWPFALAGVAVFNLMNAELFRIGIFPWFMLAATLLLFTPGWPRLRETGPRVVRRRSRAEAPRAAAVVLTKGQQVTVALLALYALFHLLVPFRHLLYPGPVNWTEEGHNFSWHMKLRDKQSTARFFATDPDSGRTWEVRLRHLRGWQRQNMENRPDMVLQFSHYLARQLREEGYPRIQIRAHVMSSLNGREPQLLIDPSVNLAAEARNLWPARWIMPFANSAPGRTNSPAPADETF